VRTRTDHRAIVSGHSHGDQANGNRARFRYEEDRKSVIRSPRSSIVLGISSSEFAWKQCWGRNLRIPFLAILATCKGGTARGGWSLVVTDSKLSKICGENFGIGIVSRATCYPGME
jgi:hypothetical protein